MRRALAQIAALSGACGVVPLIAAAALLWPAVKQAPAREGSAAAVRAAAPAVDPELAADLALIEEVLAKRAPDLGGTLRAQLAVAIADESRRAGFDPLLILAVIDVESDFEDTAVSPKGARGLMQIQPTTLHFLAEKEGLRLSMAEVERDATVRVRLGIRYLRRLQEQFGGSLDLALMAYNAGPSKLRRFQRNNQDLEPFLRYSRAVRRDFRRFREGMGLGGDWALALRAPAGEQPGALAE